MAASPLYEIKWLRVILDEAHVIRDPKTRQSMAASLLEAERRWCITGTPFQVRIPCVCVCVFVCVCVCVCLCVLVHTSLSWTWFANWCRHCARNVDLTEQDRGRIRSAPLPQTAALRYAQVVDQHHYEGTIHLLFNDSDCGSAGYINHLR